MTLPSVKLATYQDLLDTPEHVVAEIVAGVLHTSPRPAARHARAASTLGMDIGSPFQRGRDGPGGWWILDEPELHLGDDILVPDLAGWQRQRMPTVPDEPFFTQPPDWVCEVLSPSTARFDRVEKMPIHAATGVAHIWLLEPQQQTLEVYRLQESLWTLVATYAGEMRVRAEPFDAIELELGALWTAD